MEESKKTVQAVIGKGSSGEPLKYKTRIQNAKITSANYDFLGPQSAKGKYNE